MATVYERGCPADILLIDDNPGDAKLIELAFKRVQIPLQVTVVGTAEQGLDLLHGKDDRRWHGLPDIVFLDLNLPSMHGLTFLELVKADPVFAAIPVLVLSSSSAQTDIAASYSRHANGFVTKPSNLDGYLAFAGSVSDFWFKTAQSPQGSAPGK